MRSKRFDDAFNKLAAAEDRFLSSQFLAPLVQGGWVSVRLAGIVRKLQVTPKDFEGWGVFRPTSHAAAELVRPASLDERQRYLRLFPLVRLILCQRAVAHWLAVTAHQGDRRFRIAGMAPLNLVEEAQQFEVVRARFDGGNFWFEDIDPAGDPAMAAWLRKALNQTIDPNQLDRPGLTPEARAAYAVNYFEKEEVRKQQEAARVRQRLREALRHAGADLVDYLERRDSYRVRYSVGGREHVSAVHKDDLTVQVAGICLSGQDRHFDLTSLVGVIREAGETGEIIRVGDDNGGIEEDHYWHVHPPGDE